MARERGTFNFSASLEVKNKHHLTQDKHILLMKN